MRRVTCDVQLCGPSLTCRAVKANAELQKDLFGDAGVLEEYRVKLAEALGALRDGLLAENERVGEEKVRGRVDVMCCLL